MVVVAVGVGANIGKKGAERQPMRKLSSHLHLLLEGVPCLWRFSKQLERPL